MEAVRAILKTVLAKALHSLEAEDRLAAAWPLVCGKAMSKHGLVTGYNEGVVRISVSDELWRRQMASIREQLAVELGKVAEVPVREIHFEVRANLHVATQGRGE